MIYAMIDTAAAEKAGFKAIAHRTVGDKMIINENELRIVNGDIEEAARQLGGVTMSYDELMNEINTRNE